jgi:hypothetical protein
MGLEGLVSKRRDRAYRGGPMHALDQDAMGRGGQRGFVALSALCPKTPKERHMSQPFEASRSLTALEQDSTIIAVIEMAQSKWLVAAVVPGIKRRALKKLDADAESLLKLLHRWRRPKPPPVQVTSKRAIAAEKSRGRPNWLKDC